MTQTSGLTARGVPPQPVFLFYIKIAILVLSVIILALAAWAISITGGAYYLGAPAGAFMIFVTIKTFIVYGGALGIELGAPHLFYRIVALIVYGLSLIFWLSGWAYAASNAAAWLSWSGFGFYDYGPYKKIGSGLAACAGLGAVVWILAIVHFVFFIRACLADPGNGQSQAELGAVKQDPAVQTYPAQPYPAQPFPAQQQYPAQPQQPYATQQPYTTQ